LGPDPAKRGHEFLAGKDVDQLETLAGGHAPAGLCEANDAARAKVVAGQLVLTGHVKDDVSREQGANSGGIAFEQASIKALDDLGIIVHVA
jgi:hypothetical protein